MSGKDEALTFWLVYAEDDAEPFIATSKQEAHRLHNQCIQDGAEPETQQWTLGEMVKVLRDFADKLAIAEYHPGEQT
jgi:hypothetical protein